ncbi:hypothetical protein [Pelagicoccus sp. SDUM812002]|uniref:hypothetical protein n=1 Tax=Pelagicoccus sp. SDUM812002 TaxID=3041266 RepID=UPI00280E1F27|nr:hypothetical protein [Pelagicoccus sp. SDUM812002]MDQ8186220.1 hypothetical protein [Pelagicoccus sp. SDUM812002]
MTKELNTKRLNRIIAIGMPLAFLIPNPSFGQAVEWDPEKGYHAEEWYDPSDWFDDDSSIDYENDALDYDLDYGSDYWNTAPWTSDIRSTDALTPDYNYGVHYVWSEKEDNWVAEYGTYNEAFSYKMSFDEEDMSAATPSADQNASNNALSSDAQKNDGKSLKKVSGTVEAFSKMNLRYSGGFDMNHSLARIKLDNGKSAIIDLGYSSLILADLKKGDDITLMGNRGQINGQNVFIATELETDDGSSINLERALTFSEEQKLQDAKRADSGQTAQDESSSNQSQQDDYIVLSGTVEDYEKKRLSTEEGERTFIKLRLQNGDAATVDIGADTSLSDLDLSEGDNIRVEGSKESIENRSVLVAKSISVAGEKVKQG